MQELISASSINRDAVAFIQRVKQDSGYEQVFVTGLLAAKNDCYDPKLALSAEQAEAFHSAQAGELAGAIFSPPRPFPR